jgi:hypothetical protein
MSVFAVAVCCFGEIMFGKRPEFLGTRGFHRVFRQYPDEHNERSKLSRAALLLRWSWNSRSVSRIRSILLLIGFTAEADPGPVGSAGSIYLGKV